MSWIKRNLFFAVGGAVALGLMGLAFYYLFTKIQVESQVSEELNARVEQLNSFSQQKPYPNETNVVAVRREKERLQEFLVTTRRYFSPVSPPLNAKDVRQFLAFLENSVAELTRDATNAGVAIPAGYGFSFASQRKKPNLKPPSFEPWITQMNEIKALCSIVFGAHVNALESIRRVPVAPEEQGGSVVDYLQTTMGTNVAMNAVFTPYEIAFRGFSADLAVVMEGFMKATNCFILKSINVEPARITFQPATSPIYQPGAAPVYSPTPFDRPKSAQEMMRERYGLNRNNMPAPPPVYVPIPSRTSANTNLTATVALSEKPLRVVMLVEIVKFRSESK